jgi:hypothetical protein
MKAQIQRTLPKKVDERDFYDCTGVTNQRLSTE